MAKAQYFYASGKRKTSVARVKLLEGGKGDVSVNGIDLKKYFVGLQPEKVKSPLRLTGNLQNFNIEILVQGGGKNAQSEAARHGISRALILFDPALRSELKKAGFLRRDSRVHERKKPGLKRARRAPQWAKR